jgi:glc operon protein GlcG
MRTRRIIDDNGADAVVAAAEKYANERGHRVVIAIVDPHGELIELRRTPGAQIASSRVAVDKARTAAIFVRPSREIEEQVSKGRLGALALHGASALTGGIPLKVGDEVVGAIGTSGETPDEDEAISVAGAQAPFTTREIPALSYDDAKRVAETAAAIASERGVNPVVAVVDAGGELVYLQRPDRAQVASVGVATVVAVVDRYGELVYLWRPDDAQFASVGVATDKARTAAIYRRPSKDFEEQATGGRPSALDLARAVPLQGGIPLSAGNEVAGAIGVSGASSADEDQELALAGAAAFAPQNGQRNGAAFFSGAQLAEKFETGGLLLDTARYKLDAGRRVEPGEVEFHRDVVDVMHVVEGTATVVTGGEMRNTREVAPGEIRAESVDGGTPHDLREGDVLAIPNGVPHQFTQVSDPFLYFVVKVEA